MRIKARFYNSNWKYKMDANEVDGPHIVIDGNYIDSVIAGLKNLYEELVVEDKDNEAAQAEGRIRWFENERSKAIQSLKEIFVHQQKSLIEQRRVMNSNNVVLFKKFTRVFVVKHILSYLELDEILKLTGVCIYFNSLIKSAFFIKYIVALKEKTKIQISFDTFSNQPMAGSKSAAKPSQVVKKKKAADSEAAKAQLEVMKNVKEFLTEKLKKSEEQIFQLENDIKTIKNLLKIEKGVNQKEQSRIGELERELKDERVKHDQKEIEMKDKLNELDVKLREKQRDLKILSTKYAEIKTHKTLLKEEVCKLMEQVKTLEFKCQNSESTVNTIAEFFNNNTLKKLETLKARKVKERREPEAVSEV